MAITFDGAAKIISLDSSLVVQAKEIYSRWKDWVSQSDNAKFHEAFRVVGGDNLGGGSSAPSFYFLRTDLGWRIRLPEATVDVTLDGNLVPEGAGDDMIIPPVGSFSPSLTINRSSVAQMNLEEFWTAAIAASAPGTAGYMITRLLNLMEADEVYSDINGQVQKFKRGTTEELLAKDVIRSPAGFELKE